MGQGEWQDISGGPSPNVIVLHALLQPMFVLLVVILVYYYLRDSFVYEKLCSSQTFNL